MILRCFHLIITEQNTVLRENPGNHCFSITKKIIEELENVCKMSRTWTSTFLWQLPNMKE